MFRFGRVFLWLFILCSSLHDSSGGINHGLNTTFDPNSWGGAAAVSCLTAAVGGTCATGYNATCNGIASDSAALASWRTANASNVSNPAQSPLYIPPGSKCVFDTGSTSFLWDGTIGHSGVQKAVIWAYGASATAAGMQTSGFFQDNLHSSRINTANIGDDTVTLTPTAFGNGEISRYAVGNWICIDGVELQTPNSYPPNFSFFEFHRITNINPGTGVITLDAQLSKQYKSTWPLIDAGSASTTDLAGPASIHLMDASWNTDSALYGLTVPGPNGVNSSGRKLAHYNVSFNGNGVAPSTGVDISYTGSYLGTQVEVDKEITTLAFRNSSAVQILFQSSSIDTVIFSGVSLTGGLNGTPNNLSCTNSVLNNVVFIGPTQFGHGNSLSFTNCTIPVSDGHGLNSGPTVLSVDPSIFSYSNGTFSVAVASDHPTIQWAVPGEKYFFATAGNAQCSTATSFAISDISVVSTTLNITTGSWTQNGSPISTPVALPTPCSGGAASKYIAYPAATITQTNSGPMDLTVFAAP